MKKINFEKYHGAGNDFIIIDNRGKSFDASNILLIEKLCDRHFGIGSDGLMLIQNVDDADFEMVFFNPDGSKSLCGNGSRCAIAFAFKHGMISEKGVLRTTDGLHQFEVVSPNDVAFEMRDVNEFQNIDGNNFLDTGSPHLVIEVDDVDQVDVISTGRKWRNDTRFSNINGTNVNFVSEPEIGHDAYKVRTYERGVENETLACGTGVTAVALALALKHNIVGGVKIKAKGGELTVRFTRNQDLFSDIWLQGPAQYIYTGTIDA